MAAPLKSTAGSSQVACFGAFKADLRAGELLKNGRRIRLQEQPFQILTMLLEHPGEMVTREELRQKLWHADTFVDFDHGLNNAINRLREALGDSADNPRYIETMSRRGYRFLAPVQRDGSAISAITSSGRSEMPAAAEPITSGKTTGRARKWKLALGISAAFAIVLALIFVLNLGGWRNRLLGTLTRPQIRSIAVLPLENLTGDPAQEYFADGMTDALTTEFAQTAPVRVISRTSAMQYKGKHKPLPEIAQELNVDAVVEGSVVRSGNRVRITAQLIHAATDRHLWANSYERQLNDILGLQRDISRAIANEVQIKLSKEQQTHLASLRQVDPDAYEAYLRGISHVDTDDASENETAIAMLERATTLDPNFALAHASLARAYVIKYWLSPRNPVWAERAAQAVERALSLDPQLADAYLARAHLAWTISHPPYEEAAEKAAKDYRHALSLNPNLVDAHTHLGMMCLHIGLLERSLEELQTAVALDPRNPIALYRIPRVHMYQQQYALALAEFERREFAPDWQRALALQYLGRRSEAFEFIEKLEKDFPRQEDVASTYAILLAASGEKRKAEKEIRIAIDAGEEKLHFHHAEYNIASAYALMGNHKLALVWLHRTANEGFPCYPLFKNDPNLDRLRNDTQFKAFLEQMRLQWEHYKAIVQAT